ncbi:MAG: putative ABC transporter permease subunit [Bradymonadia bacterium]
MTVQPSSTEHVNHLLWPRWRTLRNAPQNNTRRARLLLFSVLGVLFMVSCFIGAKWLFAQFAQLEFLAEPLMRRVVSLVLTFFTALLLLSSTITAFTTLYLADDLPLLLSSPVPIGRLYMARLVETWAQSSWMMLVFALPMVAGCGPALGAPWWFYVALGLLCLPLTLICGAAGTVVAMVLARALPARRGRDALVVLSLVGFVALYVTFRVAQPDQFVRPDGVAKLVEMIQGLAPSGAPLSPADWVVEGLFAMLRGDAAPASLMSTLLISGAGATCALGAWVARGIYLKSFWLSQEGQGGSVSPSGRRRRPARIIESPQGAITRRDSLIFFRTIGQWSQLLLVGALGAVYIFNFHHLRTLGELGIAGSVGLFFMNQMFGGFVLTTLAVRFLYPSVSLEGRGIWAIRSAPITARQLLTAKVRWGLLPLGALALGMVSLGQGLLNPDWIPICAAGLTALLHTWTLSGLAVGLGATDPRFDEDNPARIASSIGGVVFMLLSVVYLLVSCGALYLPLRGLYRGIESVPGGWGGVAGGLVVAFAIAWALRTVALRAGARRLERLDR